jgi:hypothetical protein
MKASFFATLAVGAIEFFAAEDTAFAEFETSGFGPAKSSRNCRVTQRGPPVGKPPG